MKITKEDMKTMRREIETIARQNSRETHFVVFVGSRYNTDEGSDPHENVLLVSRHPDWEDTDLYDNSIPWSHMRGNLETTPDGRAAYDFWIYERGQPGDGHGDLVCNAQAYFDDRGLSHVDADVVTTWSRGA